MHMCRYARGVRWRRQRLVVGDAANVCMTRLCADRAARGDMPHVGEVLTDD